VRRVREVRRVRVREVRRVRVCEVRRVRVREVREVRRVPRMYKAGSREPEAGSRSRSHPLMSQT
jgi:hypothetical protein